MLISLLENKNNNKKSNKEELLIQQWIKNNTFECPLGRITKKQCIENRKRPLLSEKINKEYILKVLKGDNIKYMPRQCFNCTVYKKYFTENEIIQQSKEINNFRKTYFISIKNSILNKLIYKDTIYDKDSTFTNNSNKKI